MDTSTWPTYDTVRRPRWRALVNGTELLPVKATLHTNNHYRADGFDCEFALNAVPAMQSTWDDAQDPISIEFQAGFLPPGAPEGQVPWQSMFVGEIDEIKQSPLKGTVAITARDLSCRLIDKKSSETFANQTSSQVATVLAGRVSLGTDIDTTTTKVGNYYAREHDKITGDGFNKTTTYWDLLVYLARQEGYDVWVGPPAPPAQGLPQLHFKKSVDAATASAPLQLVWSPSGLAPWPSIPVLDISKDRHTKIAKDVRVTMKFWDPKQKTSSEVGWPPASGGSKQAQNSAQDIVLPPKPGLNKQAALQYVQSQYKDIVAHERLVTLEMPVEFAIDPRSVVQLSGTGGSFDYRYYVDHIDRSFSVTGCTQSVALKNHQTESETSVS